MVKQDLYVQKDLIGQQYNLDWIWTWINSWAKGLPGDFYLMIHTNAESSNETKLSGVQEEKTLKKKKEKKQWWLNLIFLKMWEICSSSWITVYPIHQDPE